MNKLSSFLERKLMPLGDRLNKVRFLEVIRSAMIPLIPLIIIGSISLILLNFPYINVVVPKSIMGTLSEILNPLTGATINIVALILSYLIGFNYAKTEKNKNPGNEIYTGIITLVAYLIVIPNALKVKGQNIENVIPKDYLGSQGMFVALILCYFVAMLYCRLIRTNLKIKLPKSVPPAVSKSFESIIPGFVTLVIVCSGNYLISLTSYGTIHGLINKILQQPLMHVGTGLTAILVTQGLAQLLWFFGIHGDQITGSVMDPILLSSSLTNLSAYRAGKPRPYIFTYEYKNLFVQIAFISLVIAIFMVAKSSQLKELSKVMLGPAAFGISEPLVFGLPVVMNVTILIPWVLSRPLFGLISYLFIKFGLCPHPTGVSIPWTTPPIISGFLVTNSIMGSIVQIICLVAGVLLFLPFVKVLDKTYVSKELEE